MSGKQSSLPLRRVALSSVASLSLLSGLAALAPAWARDSADGARNGPEEIIVSGHRRVYKVDSAATATKLPMSLKDTPQSITVITRQRIEDFNLNSIEEVMEQTPGVTVRSLDSNRISFNARGFAIQNFQLDGVPTVFQTGPYANSVMSDMSVYERVEVVRGATGLVTGTGDPSATVNLIRKSPGREFGGYLNLTGGSWDYYRIEGDVTGPLAADGDVRARLVGAYTDTDSYVNFQHDKSPSLYGVVEADLSSSTRVRAGMDYLKTISDGGAWSAAPLYYADGTPTDLPRSYSAAAKWNEWDRKSISMFGALEQDLGADWVAHLAYNRRKSDDESLLFAGGNGFPNRDGTGVGIWDYYGANEQTEHAFDAYASGPVTLFGRTHDIVVGANHYDHEFSVMHASITERQYSLELENIFTWDGDVPRPTTENLGIPAWTDQTRETGGYGMVRLNPMDGVKIIAGARYTDWRTYTDRYDTEGELTTSQEDRTDEQRVTPYGGIVVDLGESLSAFASYSSVFNPQNVRDRDNEQLSPVVGGNYEAGVKAEVLDERLYVSVNGFHMKQDNVAELDPDVPPNSLPDGSSAYRAVSGVKTWGGEFEVAGEITPGWTISGGYTYARSEDSSGDRVFTNNPLHIARFYTTYRLPALERLTVGGGVSWQSEIYQLADIPTGEFENGAPVTRRGNVRQGGYATANLMARYALTDGITLGANVTNLFDKKYYRNVGFYNAGYYGEPRRFTVSMRSAF